MGHLGTSNEACGRVYVRVRVLLSECNGERTLSNVRPSCRTHHSGPCRAYGPATLVLHLSPSSVQCHHMSINHQYSIKQSIFHRTVIFHKTEINLKVDTAV